MSHYSDEALNKLLAASYTTPKEGEIIKATIIRRTKNGVLLNLGLKAEGFLPFEEFSSMDAVAEGKEIYVLLEAYEDRDGFPVISKKKANFQLAWGKIKHHYENGEMATITVRKRIKGGFAVDLFGVEAFLPSSQIEFKPPQTAATLIGQTMAVKIVKINMLRKNIVVSRKLADEEELLQNRMRIFNKIKVGDIIDGTVRNLTDYGAFVDIGGVDVLLHISDLAWDKITHPSEILKVNDKVKVKVLSMNRNTGRIAVGLKQLQPHPWEAIENRYPVGTKIKGKVTNVAPHGAFIEIEKDITGFVPVSEISWSKDIKDPSSILKAGDIIEAVVLSVDRDEQRIYLGMKQATPDPWSVVEEMFKVGQKVPVKVISLKDFGAFVRLSPGIEGLIHVNDFCWDKKVNKASDYLKKGQRIEAVIRSIDRKNRRISLSIKHCQEDPFTTFIKKHSVGDKITGKISDILATGLRITIEGGLEEFIRVSYLKRRGKQLKDLYKVGEEIETTIKKINPKLRRISLIERDLQKPAARKKEEVKPAADKFTLADIIGSQKKEERED